MAAPEVELVLRKPSRRGPPTEQRVLATAHGAVLEIGGTPPSFNVTAGAHWTKHRKAKRDWQDWLGLAMMAKAVPRKLLRVEATARVQFPAERRRDEGNFRVVLEKALGDVLVEGDWLPDDTPDRYTFGAVTIDAPMPVHQTLVTLTYYKEARR